MGRSSRRIFLPGGIFEGEGGGGVIEGEGI